MRSNLLLVVLLAGCGLPEETQTNETPTKGTAGRVFYKVTNVEGTYGGVAHKVMAPGWTDTLTTSACTFVSAGTNANQNPFVGDPVHDTYSKGISVAGETRCPATFATSTEKDSCSAPALLLKTASFQWDIKLSGWEDDSVVTLKGNHPSGLPLPCNFASLSGDKWSVEATTTLKMFRAGNPFPVRFVGQQDFQFDGASSHVTWDISITIVPL